MRLSTFLLLGFIFSSFAQAAVISIDKHCARETKAPPPPHTIQDIQKLQDWIVASAALAFAKDELKIDYNKDAFMKTCPNQPLFNYGLATPCLTGLADGFTNEYNSWTSRLKSESPTALKSALKNDIEKFSKKFNADPKKIIPSEYPPPEPKNALKAKPKI